MHEVRWYDGPSVVLRKRDPWARKPTSRRKGIPRYVGGFFDRHEVTDANDDLRLRAGLVPRLDLFRGVCGTGNMAFVGIVEYTLNPSLLPDRVSDDVERDGRDLETSEKLLNKERFEVVRMDVDDESVQNDVGVGTSGGSDKGGAMRRQTSLADADADAALLKEVLASRAATTAAAEAATKAAEREAQKQEALEGGGDDDVKELDLRSSVATEDAMEEEEEEEEKGKENGDVGEGEAEWDEEEEEETEDLMQGAAENIFLGADAKDLSANNPMDGAAMLDCYVGDKYLGDFVLWRGVGSRQAPAWDELIGDLAVMAYEAKASPSPGQRPVGFSYTDPETGRSRIEVRDAVGLEVTARLLREDPDLDGVLEVDLLWD